MNKYGRQLLLSMTALLSACGSLLPSEQATVSSVFRDYGDAESRYSQAVRGVNPLGKHSGTRRGRGIPTPKYKTPGQVITVSILSIEAWGFLL